MERTYHNTSAAYVLPNDAPEHERLNEQAIALHSMMNGQANHAPLHNPQKILEVGCGTGVMMRHFVEKYDTAQQVIGVDLSTMPALDSRKTTFLQGDIFDLAKTHPLLKDGGFDYVFSRLLIYGISDWPSYIQQAKDLLASGGWLELQEGGQVYLDGNGERLADNDSRWVKRQAEACTQRGLDTRSAEKLADWLRAAGFVDVHVKEFHWVIGRWKGRAETDLIGEYSVKYLSPMFVETYRKILSSSTPPDELEEDIQGIRETFSWAENGKHTRYKVVYGRKP